VLLFRAYVENYVQRGEYHRATNIAHEQSLRHYHCAGQVNLTWRVFIHSGTNEMIKNLAITDVLNNEIPKLFFGDSAYSCHLLHADSLLGLFFDLEDGSNMFP
jgi:hypothetical protein